MDNALWKAKWPGKLIFNESWDVKVEVSKSATADYQVDALSGATLTSNGVSNMLKYWLGDGGFGPYLKSLAGHSPADESEPAAENSESASGHAARSLQMESELLTMNGSTN